MDTHPSWPRSTLTGAARLFRPVLAAGALVVLLILVPGRHRHPAIRAAEAFLDDMVGVPTAWLAWTLQRDTPAAETLMVHFARSADD